MLQEINADISNSIDRFSTWLNRYGYAGYDLYDLWATGYGKWAKELYHRKKLLGAGFVIPVFLADFVWPGIRRYVGKKTRSATADGHFALAFIRQYDISGDTSLLKKAEGLAQDMLEYSLDGYSGICWGYPFDWQTNRGFWPKGTPYITTTPYAYYVFTNLYDRTENEFYLETARSIATFVHLDLNKTEMANGTVASSYSPLDKTSVVNANAYRAALLADAWKRFSDEAFLSEAEETLKFILEAQDSDGSWLYDVVNPKDRFIDNFHTCMVIKNLYKANSILGRDDIKASINRGYEFYLKNLIDEEGRPKPYFKVERLRIKKREMYDYAEGISLGTLLANTHAEALPLALRLANQLISEYQVKDGYFVTREFIGGIQVRFPMPRWPQAQLFAALSFLKMYLDTDKEADVSDGIPETAPL